MDGGGRGPAFRAGADWGNAIAGSMATVVDVRGVVWCRWMVKPGQAAAVLDEAGPLRPGTRISMAGHRTSTSGGRAEPCRYKLGGKPRISSSQGRAQFVAAFRLMNRRQCRSSERGPPRPDEGPTTPRPLDMARKHAVEPPRQVGATSVPRRFAFGTRTVEAFRRAIAAAVLLPPRPVAARLVAI